MWLPFRVFVGFRRPRHAVLGLELSGEIEAVGSEITRFKPGESILAFTGNRFGAYAEYVCLHDGGKYIPFHCVIASKPPGISHAEAATVPTRATLALYSLKKAQIENSQQVLIYGASGGIGTFAVQLAKHFGAQVTAVCSAANVALVKSLGADRVLDYTNDHGSDVGGPFDIVFDAAGARKSSPLKLRCQAALGGRGRAISVDSAVRVPAADLDMVCELIVAGKIRPVVDRVYPLAEAANAHRYVEAGHKHGGVAIIVTDNNPTHSE